MNGLLRKKLKAWQHDFRKEHRREPRRSDIAQVPEIAAIYDVWTQMSKLEDGSSKQRPKSVGASATESRRSQRSLSPSSSKLSLRENCTNGGMAPLPATPKKSVPSAVDPRTPTHTGPRASRSRSPFQTPTKTPSRLFTPSSVVKLRTPPAAAAGEAEAEPSPGRSGEDGLHADPRFHYNASPSSFRALVGAHSHIRSLNNRVKARKEAEDAFIMKQAFTPRTRARKRLRGEDVPPTPHRGEGTATSSAPRPGSQPPRKRRAQAQMGQTGSQALTTYWNSHSVNTSGRPEGRTDTGPHVFGRTDPQGPELVDAMPAIHHRAISIRASHFDLFQRRLDAEEAELSTSQSSKRFQSFFGGNADGTGKGSEAAMDSHDDGGPVPQEEYNGAEDADTVMDVKIDVPVPSRSRRLAKRVRPTVLEFPSSLDDDDNGEVGDRAATKTTGESSCKAVYLRAYQRFGELSIGHRGEGELFDDDDGSSSEEYDGVLHGLFTPSFKRRTPPGQAAATSTSHSPQPQATSTSYLDAAPSALQSLRSHQQASQRRALADLLDCNDAGSRPGSTSAAATMMAEMERELTDEAARDRQSDSAVSQDGGKSARTWGQAKVDAKGKGRSRGRVRGGEDLLGKAKRGFGTTLGTDIHSDEDEEEKQQSRRAEGFVRTSAAASNSVFRRIVEFGVEAEEDMATEEARCMGFAGEDDDWASEADSAEWWGVGDGVMDPTDVC